MPKYAKLQKNINGKEKYVITPMIPGGYLTPQTLIKIGEVAKKYNASVRLTSAQKIAIGNIKEEDIDSIWEELEMEPAIKNICSVINVEMCSANFCRRSKYPIIGLGIKVTKKFHGMELPGKVKIAVAGCKNACINAYTKDIGILSNVEGKLFIVVGGKGGVNPRKYDILAENLNEIEVIDIIDKLLYLYKRNALDSEKFTMFIERIGIKDIKENILLKI
ncbi:NAD(P)/FAD-dependent oxidoreductase [Romboutsia sp. 1001713B170207_170306_H8]|uniref:NAD(P)/FAD-dependent oxidoreductase n=1 Tax=Romboutsia sp. 1001713B170207_170306_H8 TaxID=2787112 RepID=UPI000822A645|nr:NAD(P)/FAD-dependent oxidoreductase [Romboutsia sp. 1001713B170207_170306_H8]SCH54046.1 Sulfite reductase [NADPH] hemoprotein beta-component [uncultured Clostridium sp.]